MQNIAEKLLPYSVLFILCVSESVQYDFVVFKNSTRIYPEAKIVKRQAATDPPRIQEFHVITNVANRFAETTIISRVENVDRFAKQTAFSVVLPERAFISGFSMELEGTRYVAFVKEKNEAMKLFSQSLSTGQTAGHVAVSARYSNRFTVNINIESLSKVIFNLTYEELLQRENGQYEIITNIQPGQIVKKMKVEVNIRESQPLSFVRVPFLRSGNNEMLQHSAILDPHAKVRIYNTSAFIVFQPDVKRQLEFSCAGLGNQEYTGFAGQFVVKYDVNRTSGKGETIYQDGIILSFYAPSPKRFDPLPKHIVFVLDTSGSMNGQKITQLQDAMSAILPQLNEEDIFSIVQFDSNVYVWDLESTQNDVFSGEDPGTLPYGKLADRLQTTYIPPAHPATEENIAKVKAMIDQLLPNKLTNSIGALEVGLYLVTKAQLENPKKYEPILVFLTDGAPTVGIELKEVIINITTTLNKASYSTPIYSLCFGDDSVDDWNFLRNLSLKNDAFPTKIPVDKDSSILLQNFYKRISVPLLSNGKFNSPEYTEATQTNFKLYFNGSELVFAAKGVSGKNITPISISANAKGGPVNLETQLGVPLTKLEKVYAYLKVKELADQYHITGDIAIKELGQNLALKYSLVSEFTSLIVVKPDSQGIVDTEDASIGIFPDAPSDLPLCQENITDWIIDKYGTTESPTTEPPSENDQNFVAIETDFKITDVTTEATTTTTTTTTERIITCAETTNGCCNDGLTFANGPNSDGCDPVPRSESCSMPADIGTTCSNITKKWFYSTKKHECRTFRYNGCGGNGNRFPSQDVCEKTCVTPTGSERCKLPISLGRCNKKQLYWFYDKVNDECVEYLHGGCLGNSNKFESNMDCLNVCNINKMKETIKGMCFQPKDKGRSHCRRFVKRYYFDSSIGQCRKFWFSGCGGNDNRFRTKDICEKMCIYSKNRAVCHAPPKRGSCQGNYPIYYFNPKKSVCDQFNYSGCGGNRNKFSSKSICENFCLGP